MNYDEGKSRLLDGLLSQVGLQKMMDIGAEVLGNPIFIAGMDLHAIANSNTIYVCDIGWNVVKMNEREMGVGVRDACLQEILGSGAVEATSNNLHPIISSFDFTPNRYIGCRVSDHGMTIANVTLIECKKPFTEEDSRLLKLFCQTIVFDMRQLGQAEMQTVPYYRLVEDLLNRDVHIKPKDLESRARNISLQFPRQMRVVLLQCLKKNIKFQQSHIRMILLREFPNSLGIVRGSEVLMLISWEGEKLSELQKNLENWFRYYEIKIGISQIFQNPCNLWLYYLQAKSAIDIGELLNKGEKSICYEDVMLLQMALSACENQPIEMFYSSLFNTLLEYDDIYKTSYVEDLNTYFRNGKNIVKTAEALFIHKNSMYYRINKIEKILGKSLKDDEVCRTLQLSLQLYQYREILERRRGKEEIAGRFINTEQYSS